MGNRFGYIFLKLAVKKCPAFLSSSSLNYVIAIPKIHSRVPYILNIRGFGENACVCVGGGRDYALILLKSFLLWLALDRGGNCRVVNRHSKSITESWLLETIGFVQDKKVIISGKAISFYQHLIELFVKKLVIQGSKKKIQEKKNVNLHFPHLHQQPA